MKSNLEHYLNKSTVVIFEWSNKKDWLVEYVSANCKKIFGYDDIEFISSSILYIDIIHKDDIEMVTEEIEKNLIQKEFIYKPYRIITKNNQIKYISDTTYANMDKNGNIISFTSIINDCTKLILTQKELEKHKAMISSIPYPMSIINNKYQYEVVNNAYSKYYNKKSENIIGKNISEFLGKELFNKEIKANIDKALNRQNVNYVIEVDFKDMGKRFMNMHYEPFVEEDGNVNSIVSYGIDITKEKKYSEQLLFSNNYSNSIFDAIPNIIIASDGEHIKKANRVMLDFLGYKTLKGFQKEHDCICDYFENENGYIKATMGKMTWLEYILKHKEKLHKVCIKRYNIKHHFLLTARGLNFDDKNRSIAVFTDITYLTDVEKSLQQSEINLTRIIDNIPLATFVIDANHNVIHWNKECEKLTNVKKENIVDTSNHSLAFYGKRRVILADIIMDQNQKEIRKYYSSKCKSSIRSNNLFECEDFFQYLGKCGRWLSFTATPITNNEGKIVASIEMLQDITEEKLMEQKLSDQEKIMLAQSRHAAMGEMISMIAHQWRQPLSVIAMGANNIMADIELDTVDNETLKNGAIEIMEQTQELSHTIDDFKNFFKPGKKVEEVLPEDIFNEAFKMIGKSLENNTVKVITHFSNGKKIQTYSRELMQVFINIIKNAKEALVENNIKDRKIIISIDNKSDAIDIKIKDNGGGIPKDIIDKIFDPYYTTKNEQNGTGLGLYMSKTIIEKHLKGTIKAYNDKNGACFEIQLPYTIAAKDEV